MDLVLPQTFVPMQSRVKRTAVSFARSRAPSMRLYFEQGKEKGQFESSNWPELTSMVGAGRVWLRAVDHARRRMKRLASIIAPTATSVTEPPSGTGFGSVGFSENEPPWMKTPESKM